MKNLMFLILLFIVSSCAMFGSEKQYNKGEWHLYADSSEVAKIQRDKAALENEILVRQMALDKLKSQPVDIKVVDGAIQGYKGIVQNLSDRRVNIIIRGYGKNAGPETRNFFLASGDMREVYLLPGDYHATPYGGNGSLDNGWTFSVSVQKYDYNRQDVHWWYAYDPRGR